MMTKENEDWCHYSDMPSPNAYNKTKKMKQQDKIAVFVERLENVGVEVELSGNYPWIYMDYINGKRVTEKFNANHGFTVAFTPIKKGQEIEFTDIAEIFKLIRKYCT